MNQNPYAAPQTVEVKKPELDKVKDLPLATRGQRFAASLIDGVILIVVFMVVISVIGFLVGTYFPAYVLEEQTILISIIEEVVALVVMSIVFIVINGPLLAAHGQTFGKLILKIKIVSNDNQLVPLPKLFLTRYLPVWVMGALPLVGNFVALIDPLLIFRANRKCLHDDMANTKVVMTYRPSYMRNKLPDKIEVPL